ncbi:AAA ATPase-like protein [Kribbella pratensis]|uniref:AAA ATPase-like protein n=1 Tax=Kribbella pratensis TaxID=2512112 RepID=A0ABY2FPP6_9ACTN|nr:AAA family ATPase [Kribbella pratensis]TDW94555.1 AAA ATPase-like protein [Kribbella pratensis]
MPELVVGRERELSTLAGLLDEVERGRGQGALLIGDAGIGKSTTAAAFADTVRDRGYAVAWGRCPETEALPYWPWRQAFRALGLTTALPDSPGPGRTTVFAEIADQLAAATARRPAVIILEDVQLADGTTLTLLRFVVGLLPELPCLLLITSRDNAVDVPETVAETLRALPPSFVRLPLAGLALAETVQLVERVLGAGTDAGYAGDVHARTGGNPFFVQELARLHASRGTTSTETPTGVRQVLERRLARLSQPAYDVLAAASVLGEDVDIDLLAAVEQTPASDVLGVLGDAEAARLAEVDGNRVRFAHSLVREVVYSGLGAVRKSDLHLRAAQALTGRCCPTGVHNVTHGLPLVDACCSADLIEANAGRVAAHYRAAIGQPDADKLSREFALIAARAAMRRSGYEQAVHFYRWAGDLGPVVRLEFGEAQVLAGELTSGRDTLRGVAREAVATGDAETAARAVLAMGGGVGGFEVDLTDREQTQLLERVVPMLPDAALKAAAMARLALGRTLTDHGDQPRELARQAVTLARETGDPRAEVAALAAWCDVHAGPDHVAERIAAAERMLATASETGDVALVLLARRQLVVALLEQGRFAEADVQIAAFAHAVRPLGLPLHSWLVPIWQGMRALMNGHPDETAAHITRAAQLAEEADSANARLMVFALRTAHACATGTMPKLRGYLDEAMAPYAGNPMADGPYAYFSLHTGAAERARAIVRHRARNGLDAIVKDAEWLESIAFFGEAARLTGDDEAVALAYDALAPYSELWVVDGIGGACLGTVALFLGRLAAHLGRPEARRLLETALEAHRAVDAETLVVETEKALAELGVGRLPRPTDTGELCRLGATWAATWRGVTAHVPDSKGVRDLAVLLARPRTPVGVLDLSGPGRVAGGDLGPLLDDQARTAYRERLRELDEDLAEAEACNDLARAEKARAERDFLARELAGALGLGGRARSAGDPVERSRKAVSMRIAAAVKAIERVHPALGRHLRVSIRTGRLCVYEPEDDVTWHCQSVPGA